MKFAYLASPPLVVAFAIAGKVGIDLYTEPLGVGSDGNQVFLKDIWPTQQEIIDTVAESISPEIFNNQYSRVFEGDETGSLLRLRGQTFTSGIRDPLTYRSLRFLMISLLSRKTPRT